MQGPGSVLRIVCDNVVGSGRVSGLPSDALSPGFAT